MHHLGEGLCIHEDEFISMKRKNDGPAKIRYLMGVLFSKEEQMLAMENLDQRKIDILLGRHFFKLKHLISSKIMIYI